MKTGLEGLAITPISACQRHLLDNLTQLYLHDFSELYAETALLDLDDRGLFVEKPPLDRWWNTPDHVPLLLRWHGRPAGFALINNVSEIEQPVDRCVAEFFVVRKYRRLGIGIAAAQAVVNHWPGSWEAAVIRKNTGARQFWAEALQRHPAVQDLVEQDHNNALWNGTIFRFTVAV